MRWEAPSGFPLSTRHSRVTRQGLGERVGINIGLGVTRRPRGAGREICPGARRARSRGPRHTGPRQRPRSYRRAAAEDEAATQGCSSKPGAPVLGGGRVPTRSHSGQECEIRGLPSPDPGVRGPGTPTVRAPSSLPKEQTGRAPRAEQGRQPQAGSLAAPSALTRPSHCPASPARALAAEQHDERRLARGMSDVRRLSPRIGRARGACKE